MFKLTCFAPRRIGGTAQRLNSSESRRNTFSPSRRAFGTMLVSMYSTARFAAASTSLGGLLEGFRYGSFLSHTGSVKTPRQTSAVLKARRCRVQASLCQLRAKSVSPSSSREASSASKTVGKGLRTGSAALFFRNWLPGEDGRAPAAPVRDPQGDVFRHERPRTTFDTNGWGISS